jgi:CheY-like chemotaxis protein
LLVDDDILVRGAIRAVLQRLGYATREAGSGEEALSVLAAEENLIHTVVLDVTMPGIGGAGTLLRMCADFPRIPVVLCTGYDIYEIDTDFAGAAGILLKPFARAEVASVMARCRAS